MSTRVQEMSSGTHTTCERHFPLSGAHAFPAHIVFCYFMLEASQRQSFFPLQIMAQS